MTLANPVSKVDIPPSNGKSIRMTRVELIHNTFNITQWFEEEEKTFVRNIVAGIDHRVYLIMTVSRQKVGFKSLKLLSLLYFYNIQ